MSAWAMWLHFAGDYSYASLRSAMAGDSVLPEPNGGLPNCCADAQYGLDLFHFRDCLLFLFARNLQLQRVL